MLRRRDPTRCDSCVFSKSFEVSDGGYHSARSKLGTALREIPRSISLRDVVTIVAMKAVTPRHLLSVATLLLAAVLAAPLCAQQTVSPSIISTSPQELAKSVHNPFEDFVKIPLQSTTGFSVGPHHNAGDSLNLQPFLPFSLNQEWDLFARPSLSVNYQPSPHEQFGIADMQGSFFFSPHNANNWIWGIGPVFQFPTATSPELGTGRWSAGPTAALIYSNGPWFGGVLTYQLMSFAGNRARGSVNSNIRRARG